MSTLAEIEAAIEHLPASEQQELLVFLSRRVVPAGCVAPIVDDPFAAIIGSFVGAQDSTGRKTEEILYGRQE